MVEIGSVIEAVVTRVEHFGVFLKYDSEEVVVLLPELSWEPMQDLRHAIHVGDRLSVLVLRYNYQKKQIVGSLRRLHPEKNPYRELARLVPGEVLHGVVISAAGADLSVRLPNGAWGYLSKRGWATEPNIGETVAVQIDSVEVDEGKLTLAPAHHARFNGDGCGNIVPETPIESGR